MATQKASSLGKVLSAQKYTVVSPTDTPSFVGLKTNATSFDVTFSSTSAVYFQRGTKTASGQTLERLTPVRPASSESVSSNYYQIFCTTDVVGSTVSMYGGTQTQDAWGIIGSLIDTNTWQVDLTIDTGDVPYFSATRLLSGFRNPVGFFPGVGVGSTVTQTGGKDADVTMNKITGQIIMDSATLANKTSVSFTWINSLISATDTVLVTVSSGATLNSYTFDVVQTSSGSCVIQVRNFTNGDLSEAIVLNVMVLKGTNS